MTKYKLNSPEVIAFEDTTDKMLDELVKNVMLYGVGFTRLGKNKQGELETTIVPFEDYMYINGKPEWVGLTDEEVLNALKCLDSQTARLPQGFKLFAQSIESILKEKNT